MSTDTVPVQNEVEDVDVVEQTIVSEAEQPEAPSSVQEQPKEEHVPLSALQKERRKRQEIEQELRWHKEQAMRPKAAEQTSEPDESHLEPATREELGKAELKILRSVEERSWIKQNPEKKAEIDDKLQEFLKQRPHLARAIEDAPNRYEEAWTLMDALTPKQKMNLRPAAPAKKDAPGNPTGMPKAAAMNQGIDVMSMNDTDFNAWRQSQRKRR